MTLQSWGEPLMVSPAQVKKTGNEKFADAPVGTGPFKLVENAGTASCSKRFKEYWGTQPNVDKLVFRRLDDPAARVAALRTGEVDFILAPPTRTRWRRWEGQVPGPAIQRAPHLVLAREQGRTSASRTCGCASSRCRSTARRACMTRGTAKPAWSMISPATAAYDPNYKPYPTTGEGQGAAQGRGFASGFETNVLTSTSGSGQMIPVAMAEWIQRDLAKVGIQVKLETLTGSRISPRCSRACAWATEPTSSPGA